MCVVSLESFQWSWALNQSHFIPHSGFPFSSFSIPLSPPATHPASSASCSGWSQVSCLHRRTVAAEPGCGRSARKTGGCCCVSRRCRRRLPHLCCYQKSGWARKWAGGCCSCGIHALEREKDRKRWKKERRDRSRSEEEMRGRKENEGESGFGGWKEWCVSVKEQREGKEEVKERTREDYTSWLTISKQEVSLSSMETIY